MKQTIITCIAAVILCSAAYAAEFNDTSSHWSREYISFLFELSVVSGMEDGLFHPDESVTTEQFTAMVIRSFKGEIASPDDAWASGYIDYAFEKGIIEDYDILNRYKPIERRSAARIVHEVLIKEYGEEDEQNIYSAERLQDLYDCHTCVGHIAQVYLKGIMTGRSATLFDNYGVLTRAEASAVITRMIDKDKRIATETEKGLVITEIQPEDVVDMVKNGAVLIDVRTAEAYESRHITGSKNIPISELEKNPYAVGNLNTPIILYCAQGYTSAAAAKLLTDAGYTAVYTIPGIEQYDYELAK